MEVDPKADLMGAVDAHVHAHAWLGGKTDADEKYGRTNAHHLVGVNVRADEDGTGCAGVDVDEDDARSQADDSR